MYLSSHGQLIDSRITADLCTDPQAISVLGRVRLGFGSTDLYLSKDEAYSLLNGLESVLHEIAQQDCTHAKDDEYEYPSGKIVCARCGHVLTEAREA